MTTPPIPLSPQQLRQRRKNLLFATAAIGLSAGLLGYLFLPDLLRGEQKATHVAESAEERGSSDAVAEAEWAAATSRSAVDAEWEAAKAQAAAASMKRAGSTQEQAAEAQSPDAQDTPADSPQAPRTPQKAETTQTATTEALTPHITTPLKPQPTKEEQSEMSAEELAKLSPWQQDIARLSKQDKLAYTSAFRDALQAYQREQWASCLAHLNDCQFIYDGSPDAWNLAACALLSSGAPDEAEKLIQRSLALNAQDSVALMAKAELHMLRRDFQASITQLEQLRHLTPRNSATTLHDTLTFHLLLCHLMLRQEMEARALVSDLNPLSDTPLYYYSQAAFHLYRGENKKALEQLGSATNIYGRGAETSSYRKWLNKCGITEKYAADR